MNFVYKYSPCIQALLLHIGVAGAVRGASRRRKCRDKLHLLSCEDTTDNVLLYCFTLKLCQQKRRIREYLCL